MPSSGASEAPFISVIIAAYNSAEFIEKAILNVLKQENVRLEVIVSDDASTDNTVEKVRSLCEAHPEVKLLANPINKGPAGARNAAWSVASGDWFAVLDSDDSYAPQRLFHLYQDAASQGADIVIDDFISVSPAGTPLSDPVLSTRRGPGRLTAHDWLSLNLNRHRDVSFGYAKPFIARRFVETAELRYNENLRNGEDFHLILSALLNDAKVYFSGRPDYQYTVRAGSVSNRAKIGHLEELIKADAEVAQKIAGSSSELDQLLATRKRNANNLITTETVLHALKSKQIVPAMRALFKNPMAIGRVASHLSEAVAKRTIRARQP